MSSSVQLDGQIENSTGQEKVEEKTPSTKDDWIIDMIFGSITKATDPRPLLPILPRVPVTTRGKHDYEEYFVPKLVSIGPYHVSNKKLWSFQKRKLDFAMKLLDNNRETQAKLYQKLSKPQLVNDLKVNYEQEYLTTCLQSSVDVLKDNDDARFKELTMTPEDFKFIKMMLLDSCFILYFIKYEMAGEASSELGRHEIFLVRLDLFLLENQIPFKVLKEVVELINEQNLLTGIKEFIIDSTVSTVFGSSGSIEEIDGVFEFDKGTQHLLGAMHDMYTRTNIHSNRNIRPNEWKDEVNFRKASELVEVGIDFKPIKGTLSLTRIKFDKSWWRFAAKVKLPQITMSNSTKPMLLNLTTYETCNRPSRGSWVTWYVCLLDRLIDDAEDVKILRKAWVIENNLSSDKEVADLIDGVATDLRPNPFAYFEATKQMQAHYRSSSNALYWQLKNEYFKSPWAVFALLGALIALFLTGVQTYYAVWAPKTT